MSEILDLTFNLIARESVTPEDAGCQAMLSARLQAKGFKCEQLDFVDVKNLFVTHGFGGPTMIFLGHTDVVPPGPRDQWLSDPFLPEIRDGYLYGRGAADMKGSVAAFVLAMEKFIEKHPNHPGTIGSFRFARFRHGAERLRTRRRRRGRGRIPAGRARS